MPALLVRSRSAEIVAVRNTETTAAADMDEPPPLGEIPDYDDEP